MDMLLSSLTVDINNLREKENDDRKWKCAFIVLQINSVCKELAKRPHFNRVFEEYVSI